MAKTLLLASSLLIAGLFAACNGPDSQPAPPASAVVATPDVGIAPPPPPSAEGPLQGSPVEIPEIWIVPSLVAKSDLAGYLKTTVEQLDWVNPGLAERVAPGTLVVIPATYRVGAGESLAAIAAATGLSEAMLAAANPNLGAGGPLPEGTVLAMPPIMVMPESTSLSATAAQLNISGAALLSANPELAGSEAIDAGTVLFLPARGSQP